MAFALEGVLLNYPAEHTRAALCLVAVVRMEGAVGRSGRASEWSAAILGQRVALSFATVCPDPAAACRGFVAGHGVYPVNHLLVAGADVARDRAGELRAFVAALLDAG